MSQKVANSPLGSFTVAADMVGSAQYQKIKLAYGADGAATDVTALNPLPVTATFSGTVTPLAKVSAATTETIISVTTASTAVLASNSSRNGGWVRNISTVDIYVSMSATATVLKPSKLAPGEVLQLVNAGCVYTGDVAAIHASTGSKSLEAVEL